MKLHPLPAGRNRLCKIEPYPVTSRSQFAYTILDVRKGRGGESRSALASGNVSAVPVGLLLVVLVDFRLHLLLFGGLIGTGSLAKHGVKSLCSDWFRAW